MKRIITTIFLFVIFLFLFPKKAEAARSLSITSDKLSLFGDEEMLVTASPSAFASDEAVLVKGVFYQENSTNYFGYTKNGDNWIKNGDPIVNQLSVRTGNWDGTIRVKTDFLDSGYKGEGDYKFKVGFYYTTSGGNLSSVNWSSNILTITISEPDPTPTPTPSPTPNPTQTPTPTPTKTPTPIASPKPTATAGTPTPTDSPVDEILGVETIFPSPTDPVGIQSSSSDSKNTFPFWAIGLVIVGLGFVGFSIYTIIRNVKKEDSQIS